MELQRYHYKREEFLEEWKAYLSEVGIEVISCYCLFNEVRIIVEIPDTFNKKIQIRCLKLCEDGKIAVRDLRRNIVLTETDFNNGIAMAEFKSNAAEMLVEMVFTHTDIPYIVFDLCDEKDNEDGGIGNLDAFKWYLKWIKVSSTLSAIHEEDYLFLKHLEQENGTIIDCGVNYGQSLRSFRALLPKCKVIGFEANPELCGILKSMEANNVNTKVFNMGVSNTNGEIVFYYVPELLCLSGSFLKEDLIRRMKQAGVALPIAMSRIHVGRLDDIIGETEHIEFIKMDIEGLEYDALEGAKELINKYHPLLLIENHGDQQGRIDDLLINYERYYYNYHLDVLVKDNICRSINYYMVPKENKWYRQWIK